MFCSKTLRHWVRHVLVAVLAACWVGVAACDTPVPTYAVQSATVRLIPDTPTIPSSGGDAFVVPEFAQAADAGAVKFIAVVQTFGATLSPLAGETLCLAPDAGAIADVSRGTATAEAAIPNAEFRIADNQVNTQYSAVTVQVPPGSTDVLWLEPPMRPPTPTVRPALLPPVCWPLARSV
jgi:hypothetical protein